MSAQFQYDVFLSHHSQDTLRVRRLAEQLRAAGLRVWFDEWLIKPGDDIYLAIERGLEASRTLVLCMSANALGSGWVDLERSTVLFRDPTNQGRRFIPLLLTDCTLPDTLRRYKYVNFQQESSAAVEELLAACRGSDEPIGLRQEAKSVASEPAASPEGLRSATAASSAKLPEVNLAGDWTATACKQDSQPYQIFLAFEVMDEMLFGSVSYPTGNGGILEGKIAGNTVSFLTRHVPNWCSEEVTIRWHAKIVGEELHGFTQDRDGQARFTAKRSPERRRYGWGPA